MSSARELDVRFAEQLDEFILAALCHDATIVANPISESP
jgi:hypothetical protein